MIKKFKIYLATISLSSFGIANFYQGFISNIYLFVGITILGLISLNIICYYQEFKTSLKDIATQVIFPAYFLSFISLSAIIEDYNFTIGYAIWLITTICYFLFASFFVYKNIIVNFNLKKVIPGWFLVFVGLGNLAIVTPQHNNYLFGQLIFNFSFLIYLIILVLLIIRLIKLGNIKESLRPSYMLLVAGPSVNLVGYFNVYSQDNYNYFLIYFLIFINFIIVVLLIFNLKKVFVTKYYPSFVAYTFPIIITSSMYISVIDNLNIVSLECIIIVIKLVSTIFVSLMGGYTIYRTLSKKEEKNLLKINETLHEK